MVKPIGVFADRAKWWGLWHGWYGYGKDVDMKVVFAHIAGDEVAIEYSWATGSQKSVSMLTAKFVGNEVELKLPVGGYLSMRMRSSGNEIEVVRRTGIGEIPLDHYGLLSRQPTPDKEFLTNN